VVDLIYLFAFKRHINIDIYISFAQVLLFNARLLVVSILKLRKFMTIIIDYGENNTRVIVLQHAFDSILKPYLLNMLRRV
jgi:hypothetical protein